VVLKEGSQINTKDIQDFIKERVAPYKYPRIIKITKEPLPKTSTGKIMKIDISAS